ncbi:unnamed protein product, partial [marine sediment metagenome]
LWKLYAGRYEETYPRFYEVFKTAADPRLRVSALELMARRNMPHVKEAVLEGLGDESVIVRRKALAKLSVLGDDPAAIPFIRASLADENVDVKWLAAAGLAANASALTALRDDALGLIAHPDPLIRQAFMANLKRADGIEEIVLPGLLDAVLSDDAMTRMSAARGLQRLAVFAGKLPDERSGQLEKILNALRRDLGGPDDVAAGAAGYALSALWIPATENAVRQALSSENQLLRARAADLLRKRKLAFDVAALDPVIRTGDEKAQLYACGTLSRVQNDACIPLLEAALASEFPSVRQAAVYALEVCPPAAGPALIAALKHNDANVRNRAAIVLGRRRQADAADALATLAKAETDARARRSAEVALALISDKDLSAVLVDRETFEKGAIPPHTSTFPDVESSPTEVKDGVVRAGSRKQLF